MKIIIKIIKIFIKFNINMSNISQIIKGIIIISIISLLVTFIIILINYINNTKNELSDIEKDIKNYNIQGVVNDMKYDQKILMKKNKKLETKQNEMDNEIHGQLYTLSLEPVNCEGEWNSTCELHDKVYFNDPTEHINDYSKYYETNNGSPTDSNTYIINMIGHIYFKNMCLLCLKHTHTHT